MINDKRIQERTINPKESILYSLKTMDRLGVKSLIISSSENIIDGVLSIGDIQRAIIKGMSLDMPVSTILRKNPRVLYKDQSSEEIKAIMIKHRMEFLPVIDTESKRLLRIYFWSDFFQDEVMAPAEQFKLPVAIMAGGLGTRLRPLTNVIPKPLIPIGNKTIIENIFERFAQFGCNDFHISVNYKADLIDYYLKEQKVAYKLHYFKEDHPLGTAGSLSLLKGKIDQTFFVTNCDILIEQDYSEMLEYHRENKNEITVVAVLKHFPIPYGIIETGEKGILENLIEKPELTFKINSGMYILEPHLLEEISGNTFLHITDFIERIKNRGGKVGVFPVSEGSWKDIGDWEEYLKLII